MCLFWFACKFLHLVSFLFFRLLLFFMFFITHKRGRRFMRVISIASF
jgi:hypothetical protein